MNEKRIQRGPRESAPAKAREPREGHALMAAPEGASSVGVPGATYRVGDDGLVEVPHEHVPALHAAGFRRVR